MFKTKKLISLMLAVSIVLSCFCITAFAEDAPEDVLLSAPASDANATDDTTEAPADDATEAPADDATEAPADDAEEPSVEEEVNLDLFEAVSDEDALATMEKKAETAGLELYVTTVDPTGNEENYLNIAIKDKKTGAIWFTNPVNATNDPYVTGSLKLQQQAQVWVSYVDAKNQTANANSKVASVNRGSYEITEIDNGIKIVYDFSREKESFKIPVEYTLTDKSFKAEVIVSEIDEYSTQRIMTISLLPHFGAGSTADEGYLFVPDGSGAIMEFNNGQGYRTEFFRPVYGRDQSVKLSVDFTVMQPVLLPVFGIVNNDNGFIGVIEGSDCDVNASTSSVKRSGHNYVYASFELRKKDSYTMKEGEWDAKLLSIIATMTCSSSNFSVEYFTLDEDDVSYSGMARKYREYLIEEYGFSKKTFEEDLPLFLEVYGAVTKNGNFLGIPTKETVAMTTYDELAQILKEASELGINNTVVDFIGWQKGGPNKKLPLNLKYEKKLGGKSAYDELIKVAEELNSEIFPRVEMVNISGGSFGYSKSSTVAKSVGKTPIQVYPYNLGSGTADTEAKPTFYLTTGLYDEIFTKFFKNYSKLGLKNLSLDTVVNTVYSDYRTREMFDISYQTDRVTENIAKIEEAGTKLLMSQPNAYALVYADYLASIPSFSSQFLVTDYAVPFVQTLLHGWVPYSSPAISESGDIEEAFLKTIETGSNLLFTITAKNTSELRDSDYNFLYAADYNVWLDTAAEMYAEANQVLGDLQDVEIQNHRKVQKDVFETVYADGTSILVNYSDFDVTVEGRTVKAMSYDVKKGGM